jgi:hypothetical protein
MRLCPAETAFASPEVRVAISKSEANIQAGLCGGMLGM